MEVKKKSRLKQPSKAADMALLLRSKDSNKANDLKSLKTDLLDRLKNGKNIQNRGFLSWEEVNKAVRPIKLNNIKTRFR